MKDGDVEIILVCPRMVFESGIEKKYHRHLISYVNSTNVLCFFDSEDSENQITNPLEDLKMWSHYGRYHTGCCLVFDKKKIINSFIKQIENNSNYTFDYGRVEYNDLENYEDIFISAFDTKEYSYAVFKKLFLKLFFNKSKYYSNENEYRFAVYNENNNCSFNVSSKINKVVIAENAKIVDVVSVVRLCNLLNIEVGRMIVQ